MAKRAAGFIVVDGEGVIWGAASARSQAYLDAKKCLADCDADPCEIKNCDIFPATQALLDHVDAMGGDCGGWAYDKVNDIAHLNSEDSDV